MCPARRRTQHARRVRSPELHAKLSLFTSRRGVAKKRLNMSQLANQIAVVTGAGRGIGRAIALKFASEGADVVCVSRTQENSEKVAGEVRAAGRKAWAVALDVADAKAVEAATEKILTDTGRIDIL